ncbi:agamous-like MADS-box protein AGL62 [Impatiens glandulifera]|uniref:agamous-like MADS-box protein AGL62 n=1 Tax=Impatiens glandulifera TaxID=253017 RepID=UPI001FB190D8|nr:agamous-like MADS-box protein AGL62 [Impatiens glandulifera]
MAKMKNESNLKVTFCKRKSGLFKKFNELITLCGAEVLLLVFSPTNRVFSYGHPNHPNVDEIVGRLFGSSSPTGLSCETQQMIESYRSSNIRELNANVMQVEELMEVEEQHAKQINHDKKVGQDQRWWERSNKEMSYQQLEHLKMSLLNLNAIVTQKLLEFSNP